ncbi:hypothetical protein BTS2_0925 [Bacillus sp. TS-2]|nr:hypothetical protein BTS2_0925 [Bacillus sp. TS-2]
MYFAHVFAFSILQLIRNFLVSIYLEEHGSQSIFSPHVTIKTKNELSLDVNNGDALVKMKI